MIKVGQIIEIDEAKLVVTKIYTGTQRFDCIYRDGGTNDWSLVFAEKYGKVIAEYSTWQEAVNSEYFKDEI